MAHICQICHDLYGSYASHFWNISNCVPTERWLVFCHSIYDTRLRHAARLTFQDSHDLHDIYHDLYIHISNSRQRNDWL